MNRARVFVAALIVAGLASAVAITRCGSASSSEKAKTASQARAKQVRREPGSPDPKLLWLGDPDRPARRIAGRVLDEGRPAPGAIVRLLDTRSEAGVVPAPRIVAAADGRFDFGAVPVGEYAVVAEKPGRTGDAASIDLRDLDAIPAPDALELHLTACTWSLFGTVEDASGGPVAAARVRGMYGLESTTGDDGGYELCVKPGAALIHAEADGYGRATIEVAVYGRQRLDVKLVPEAIVSGRVVNDVDGAPVAHALVTVTGAGASRWSSGAHQAASDERGVFRIAGIAPGRVRISAAADGLTSLDPEERTLQAGQSADDVELRLSPTFRVSGVVVAGGQPVAGARVIGVQEDTRLSGDAITDETGAFTLRGFSSGEMTLDVEDHELVGPKRVTVAGADVEDLRLEVKTMASIAGRVTAGGKPVADADVWVMRGDGMRPSATRSRDDGSYELRGVPAGTFELYAESLAAGAYTRGKEVTVAAAEKKTGVDLTLDLAGSVSGVVVEEDGAPVPNVHVRLSLLEGRDYGFATTAADGSWKAGALSGGGEYAVEVKPSARSGVSLPPSEGGLFPNVFVKDGTSHVTGVRLVVKLGKQSISGRVVDGEGKPVPDAVVRATESELGRYYFPFWADLPSATTDADGEFTVAGLLPGFYTLQARATDGAVGFEEAVAAGDRGVTIALAANGVIRGSLAGFTGRVRVSAQAMTARDGNYAVYDAKVTGSAFELTGLPPGRYSVSARSGAEADVENVRLEPGETVTVSLESRGTGTLDVTLTDLRTGRPVERGMCMHQPSPEDEMAFGPAAATRPIASGRVTLEVAAGRGRLLCSSTDFHESRDVVVTTGTTTRLALKVVTGTGREPVEVGMMLDMQSVPPTVTWVAAGGPAADAGIGPDDVVVAVDGVDVRDVPGSTVNVLLSSHGPTPIAIRVRRGDGELDVTLTPEPVEY